MIRILRKAAIAAALLLAMGDVWALGLGQIEVKSRRNQPLVAEIPIISTTPGELEALQARLASPETFRRVGLSPPTGVAADLQFSLGSDARGRPVIRVTSIRPVDQASLNFLIEVDWGQGRLVREYSALVEAPNTASAPVQPAIEAPVAPAPNVVQRPVEIPAAPAPPPRVAAEPLPAAAEPPPQPGAVPLPPPAAPSAAPAMPAAAEAPRQYGPVKQGETLSRIAGGLGLGAYSLDQNMLALLRANPDAFLGDDVNRLRQGAILRVPASGEVQQVSADEAAQVVREQMQQWRQARRAVRQPEVAATAEPARVAAEPASDAAKPSVADVPKPAKPARPARPAPAQPKPVATRGAAEARLQIIPPSAPGKANGTRSGTAAGGEGSMLQQQLRQKDEEIASKSAEIGDLKERVAALEKLQQEQQSLLSLKDSELAAAQQRLAASNKAAAAAAAAATPAATSAAKPAVQAEQPVATQPPASTHAPTAWLWGGIGIVVLAGLAWLFTRRRKDGTAAPTPRRPSFDSEALAASMTPPLLDEGTEPEVAGTNEAEGGADAIRPATGTIDLASVPPQSARVETPTWHSGWVKSDAAAPASAAPAESPKPRFLPDDEPLRQPPRAAAAQASVEQRFKLAHAFMDIGDDHSARQLLLELMDDKDPAARTEAARLLRELG